MCTTIQAPIPPEITISFRLDPTEKRAGMTLRTGNKHGFTLIEVLLSVAILSGGLALILQGLVRSTYLLSVARNRLTAYAFSASKLSEIQLAAHQQTELRQDGSFRQGRDLFSWQLANGSLTPTSALVSLTVNWQQGEHPYTITTQTIIPQEPAAPPS